MQTRPQTKMDDEAYNVYNRLYSFAKSKLDYNNQDIVRSLKST